MLVVDDDAQLQTVFKQFLKKAGFGRIVVGTGAEAISCVERQRFDLVFLDLQLPDISGDEVYRRIKEMQPDLPVVIITGYPDSEMMSRILRNGAAYDAGYRGKAWVALARGMEAGDLPLMRRGLREELSRDMGVAWQIMRALEMMGERVMREERAGGALWEEEDNREDAERYLERVAGE